VNQANTTGLVNDYLSHGIPVSAVNIDSTWETQFNNFEPDTTKFPDFPAMVKGIHEQNVKVLLWATSMVNVENPDYNMCVEKGYLVRNSKGDVRPIQWWHGSGGLLDYSNPEAVAWWHSKMDYVLDAGVDGWKVDGTDPYIIEYTLGGGALGYQNQTLSYRDYANYYYRDFLYYSREKRGIEALIMSRPVDCQIDKIATLCTPYSPYDVMYSGWYVLFWIFTCNLIVHVGWEMTMALLMG
jgi:alpha-glucosidase (family GH31 glycosyl hydrolase)